MIEVTQEAANKINSLLEQEPAGTQFRIKVIGGGCSGLQYELSFGVDFDENDTDADSNGVKVTIDEKSALYLVGSTLDFMDTLQEAGFKINNPSATNTCGCGESFAL